MNFSFETYNMMSSSDEIINDTEEVTQIVTHSKKKRICEKTDANLIRRRGAIERDTL